MDPTHQMPLLTCTVCGRNVPADDAGSTEAKPVSCPSCGALLPQLGQDTLSPTEDKTAILAPPFPAPKKAKDEPDRYQTAVAFERTNVAPPTTPASDALTQPIDPLLPATKDLPFTPDAPLMTQAEPLAGSRADAWRNPWLIGAVILVLLALFVTGILLSQTGSNSTVPQVTPAPVPSSTATASLPAGFVLVEDANDLYSFAVPSTWVPVAESASDAEVTVYTDSAHDSTFEVESFLTGLQQPGASLDKQILTQRFSSLASGDISQPVNVSLAGETWIKETAVVTIERNGEAQAQDVVIQTTTHNSSTFIIFYSSPATVGSSQNAELLQQILSTLTFLA